MAFGLWTSFHLSCVTFSNLKVLTCGSQSRLKSYPSLSPVWKRNDDAPLYTPKTNGLAQPRFLWERRGKNSLLLQPGGRRRRILIVFPLFQCIYGCYVHSAILPTFHRRCYWLLQVCRIFRVTGTGHFESFYSIYTSAAIRH